MANKKAFQKEVSGAGGYAKSTMNGAMKSIGKYVATAFSVRAVYNFGKACVNVATETQNAWRGLNSILNGQGKSFSEAQAFIQDYISDGLVPLNNAVTAYKNLAARGYSQEQVASVMNALKNSATYGRQASYTLGDAVQSATEGLKNENSILVDNAGVTKNVAKMWDEYARSINTTANKLTQEQKIQAEVNGILKETQWQMGDAANYTSTFSGRVAKLSATFTSLKTSVGDMIISVINPFIPYVQLALDYVVKLSNAIRNLMGAMGFEMPSMADLGGITGTTSAALDAADAIESTGDAATSAAKKAKRAFASFDEINQLSLSDSSGGGSSGAVGAASGVANAGATSSVANGGVTDDLKNGIESKILEITALLSVASLAIGAILAFTGVNIPLGVALIAAGAIGIVATAKLNEKLVTDNVTSKISVITAVVSAGLLAIGTILTLLGVNLPLGIALMAAGAVGLAATVAINWNSTSEKTKNKITAITAIASAASLALGILLCCTGVALPLGIALIALGAVGLVAAVAMNWETIKEKTKEPLQKIKDFASGWGLLALGIILAASGVALPLGIGLMKKGAENLSAQNNPTWNALLDKIKGVWEKIKSYWNNDIKPKIPNAFKAAINAVIAIVENGANKIVDILNKISFSVPDWVPSLGGKRFGFNLNHISIPRLAQGGWVAANSPRLAIIGDNTREGEIVTPESKIREQVMAALKEFKGGVQTVKLQLELLIKYPDGRQIIKTINQAQIEEGRILLEV